MKSRLRGLVFIAHFQRVTDEEQALEFIQAIKKKNIGRQRITALFSHWGKRPSAACDG